MSAEALSEFYKSIESFFEDDLIISIENMSCNHNLSGHFDKKPLIFQSLSQTLNHQRVSVPIISASTPAIPDSLLELVPDILRQIIPVRLFQ